VKAYPASNWPAAQRPPALGSAQVGASADSGVVQADGTVSFSSLTPGTEYYLTVDGSGQYLRAMPPVTSESVSGTVSSPAEGTGGSAVPLKVTLVGGSDGTNLRALATDAAGVVKTDIAGQDVDVTTVPKNVAPGNIRKTVATAGTAVPLNGSALRVKRAVVCALSTNTGVVVVGGSGVIASLSTRNGPYLNAGDSLELGPVDLGATYIDSTVNAEGVTVYHEA
jgi:hypothetical protein